MSNISLFTVLLTVDVGFFSSLVFWLGICVEVDVDIITTPKTHPPPLRPASMFLSLPTIFSLTEVTVI